MLKLLLAQEVMENPKIGTLIAMTTLLYSYIRNVVTVKRFPISFHISRSRRERKCQSKQPGRGFNPPFSIKKLKRKKKVLEFHTL